MRKGNVLDDMPSRVKRGLEVAGEEDGDAQAPPVDGSGVEAAGAGAPGQ